jgi:hypothetical protein
MISHLSSAQDLRKWIEEQVCCSVDIDVVAYLLGYVFDDVLAVHYY